MTAGAARRKKGVHAVVAGAVAGAARTTPFVPKTASPTWSWAVLRHAPAATAARPVAAPRDAATVRDDLR